MLQRRLFTGAIVLLGAMAAGSALAGSATQTLPADSSLVFHLDFSSLAATDLYKVYEPLLTQKIPKEDPEYKEFMNATGFVPERDIQSATFAIVGDFTGPPAVFGVVKGRFDPAKFESFAQTKGKMTIGNVNGIKTFTPVDTSKDKPTFAFLDSSTLLFATANQFVNHLERAQGKGKNVHSSPLLGPLLAKGMKGQTWLIMALPEMARQGMKANPQAAPLASIQTLAVSVDGSAGLDVGIDANTDSADNGKAAFDALNAFLAIGKMSLGSNPDMAAALNKMQLEQNGASVHIGWKMTIPELQKAVGAAMMMQGGGTAPPPGGAPPK